MAKNNAGGTNYNALSFYPVQIGIIEGFTLHLP